MMNGSDKMNNAGDTADALANFTFACPHCGQHLEAEPDWVGMECECPSCEKAIIVPHPPFVRPDASKHTDLGPAIQTISKGEEGTPPPPVIIVLKGKEGFFARNRKWLIPVAGGAAALLLIVGLVAANQKSRQRQLGKKTTTASTLSRPLHYAQPSSPSSKGPYYSRSSLSAFDTLTRSEQLAMGKVMYVWARFWSIRNNLSQQAQYGNDEAVAMSGVVGISMLALLPRVDDREAPEDFRRAWRKFVPLLAATNAGDGFFKIAAIGVSNGYQPSPQDILQLLKTNQELEDVKDEASIALMDFLKVIQRYGVENVLQVTKEVAANVDSGIWSVNDFMRKD